MATAFLGCATAPPPPGDRTAKPRPVERASNDKPYDFKSEGTIPPLKPDDAPNEPDIEERSVTESAIDVSDAEAPAPDTTRAAPPPTQETLIDGFRVQVFATADRDIAENASKVAEEQLGLPAYVELDSGMYKVRAGDFATRPEADQALAAVRRHYADAWVVASKIRAKRAP